MHVVPRWQPALPTVDDRAMPVVPRLSANRMSPRSGLHFFHWNALSIFTDESSIVQPIAVGRYVPRSTRNVIHLTRHILDSHACPVARPRMTTSPKLHVRPAFRIGGGVAEEVEEEGLGEGVELGEGGAALGPQRLRPVQHLRNPPLLRQRRQGECRVFERSPIARVLLCVAAVHECRARIVSFAEAAKIHRASMPTFDEHREIAHSSPSSRAGDARSNLTEL